jgi:hypothetical protein
MSVSKACFVAAAVVALASLGLAPEAEAHHSFATFDSTKEVTVRGVVKEFQWANPHIWIQVLQPGAGGKTVEWSIEGGSPNGLKRQGWTGQSIKPGDKVEIVVHPMKDGRPGGSLVSITVNGQKLDKKRAS